VLVLLPARRGKGKDGESAPAPEPATVDPT